MKSNTQKMGIPKKKIGPYIVVIYLLLIGSALSFAVCYSQATRLGHEREKLEAKYPRLSKEAMQPLFDEEFAWRDTGFKKYIPSESLVIILFAPDPSTDYQDTMMNEMLQMYNPGGISADVGNIGVLFAPSPALKDWSLMAKTRLAFCIDQRNGAAIQSYAMDLVGPHPSTARLEKAWNQVEPGFRVVAEARLEHNREIAKKFKGTQYIFHDTRGVNYQVRNGETLLNLLDQYYLAYPDLRRQRPR